MTEQHAPAPADYPRATRQAILELDDSVRELVQIPEWRMSAWVRSLEGIERDRYERSFVKVGEKAGGNLGVVGLTTDNARARLVSMTLCGDDGVNLFSEADILVLGHKNAAALERVSAVAQRLSGLSERDMEALKETLGEGPAAASGSGSPETSA